MNKLCSFYDRLDKMPDRQKFGYFLIAMVPYLLSVFFCPFIANSVMKWAVGISGIIWLLFWTITKMIHNDRTTEAELQRKYNCL